MTNHELPTSEWEHSHAVNEGDKYHVDYFGVAMVIKTVHDNGDVTADLVPDGEENTKITQEYTESEVTEALSDGLWERKSDGLSHELATF